MGLFSAAKSAVVQYHGEASTTRSCLKAIVRLIQGEQSIAEARLLTSGNFHAFLLRLHEGEKIVIKAGFSSGYGGEGPAGLATALQLMRRHGVEIEEVVVPIAMLERVGVNALTESDMAYIVEAKPLRPVRWYDYIFDAQSYGRATDASLSLNYSCVVPLRIVDPRIVDLALKLDQDADAALMTGYRRLERIVADRCGLTGATSQKIFSVAFQGAAPMLSWTGLESGEATGRAQLFTGCYMAFRNRRAHKVIDQSQTDFVREFLLLNELFLLEAEAV